jgi:hypothetical protein
MGVEVEKEHTPDEDVTKRISLDHLAELPDYYTRLKENIYRDSTKIICSRMHSGTPIILNALIWQPSWRVAMVRQPV